MSAGPVHEHEYGGAVIPCSQDHAPDERQARLDAEWMSNLRVRTFTADAGDGQPAFGYRTLTHEERAALALSQVPTQPDETLRCPPCEEDFPSEEAWLQHGRDVHDAPSRPRQEERFVHTGPVQDAEGAHVHPGVVVVTGPQDEAACRYCRPPSEADRAAIDRLAARALTEYRALGVEAVSEEEP